MPVHTSAARCKHSHTGTVQAPFVGAGRGCLRAGLFELETSGLFLLARRSESNGGEIRRCQAAQHIAMQSTSPPPRDWCRLMCC